MTDDNRLNRAIRGALADLVAAAPGRDEISVRADQLQVDRRLRPRPLLAIAAGLTAAAGIAAVVLVTARTTITTDVARSSAPVVTTMPPPTSTSTPSTSTTTVAATSTTVAPMPGPLQRVEFRRGTNNISVSAELVAGTTDRYVLEASAEQRMIVNLDSDNAEISFSIFAPDGSALAEGEVLASVDLPTNGDYVVEVRTTDAGGRYMIDFLIN